MRTKILLALVFCLGICRAGLAVDPPADQPDLPDLSGVWLLESSPNWQSQCNRSTLTISGDTFEFRGFRNSDFDWTGLITLAADKDPTHFELKTDAFQPDKKTPWLKYAATHDLPGIFQLKGKRLRFCFSNTDHGQRPQSLEQSAGNTAATFVRADPNFDSFPDDVRVTVLDPSGKPAAGAKLFDFMSYAFPSVKQADGYYHSDKSKPMTQAFADCATTNADGTISLEYDAFCKYGEVPAGAHVADKNWLAFADVSPAKLCHGSLTIQLQPQRLLRGKLQRDVALSDNSWGAAYLTAFGNRCGFCEAPEGDFQFPIVPGDYLVYGYGANVVGKTVPMTVPPGEGDLVMPPISLQATRIASLVGKPPPSFDKVVDWKNGPVQLSDFKGKLVLLYFWNYKGDAAQVAELMALQEKYRDKGLQIIAVHNDPGGTINTAKKLDAKTKKFLDGIWEHDIQFPVAIYFSKMNQPDPVLDIWGVTGLPAGIVIDRKGNVAKFTDRIGGNLQLDLSKDSEADAAIAKLLNEP